MITGPVQKVLYSLLLFNANQQKDAPDITFVANHSTERATPRTTVSPLDAATVDAAVDTAAHATQNSLPPHNGQALHSTLNNRMC